MSSEDVVIRVGGLGKRHEIYDCPDDRLKQFIYPKLAKLIGKKAGQYCREFWALRDISFEVRKGETLGIIGRNGSGKSTLLQLICGTLAPTEGIVEVKGRLAALLELGSGFNPEFTGRENIYLNAAVLGLSREEIDSKYEEIILFADIGNFIDQPIKTYSSGMVVRLAFAVVAHVDADILVIDEALAVGDVFFVQKCIRFLRKFMEHGTLIFVSHDINSIKSLCHEAIWLESGNLRKVGGAKEVSEKYLESSHFDNFPKDGEPSVQLIKPIEAFETQKIFKDQRTKYLNFSNIRNDLQVFLWNPQADSFGFGGATICLVHFQDGDNIPLSWIVGGERISLLVEITANADLSSPIVGFFVKDKMGQYLIGDNTWLMASDFLPKPLKASGKMRVEFVFFMPFLAPGDYSIDLAIADGTPTNHIQHHWVYDALTFKSTSSSVSGSLIGIPMEKIEISYY